MMIPLLWMLPLRSKNIVFCVTDLLALGFMDGAREEFGLDIPNDVRRRLRRYRRG